MTVCFIGHRSIQKTDELINLLKDTVITLIKKGVTTFLFGSMSEFDELSLQIVSEIKEDYPHIRRVYVRSSFQYIEKTYEDYILKLYDETYFPQKIEKAGKYSYVERNYNMIDNSNYCIFYYNENYIPKVRHSHKNKVFVKTTRNSGTKIAYEYAIKKKKEIINLFN